MFIKRIIAASLTIASIVATGVTALYASGANMYGKTYNKTIEGSREATLYAEGTRLIAASYGVTGTDDSRWLEVTVSEYNRKTGQYTDESFYQIQTTKGYIHYGAAISRSYMNPYLTYKHTLITKPSVTNSFVIDSLSYTNAQQ